MQAEQASELKDIELALSLLEEAILLRPNEGDAIFLSLQLLFSAGRDEVLLQKADEWGQRVFQEENSDALILFFASLSLSRLGRFEEAIEALQQAIRFRSNLTDAPVYYSNLAEVYSAIGDYGQAKIFYLQALSTNGNYLHARLGLAATLARLGEYEASRRETLLISREDINRSFLETPGIFYLVKGEPYFLNLLMDLAVGDYDHAESQLQFFVSSEAGQNAPEGMIQHFEEEIRHNAQNLSSWILEFDYCSSRNVVLSSDQSRLAVVCDDRIMEGRLPSHWQDQEGELSTEQFTTIQRNTVGLVDITYADENTSLRLLYEEGVVESITLTGRQYREDVHYTHNYAPSIFSHDGSRVVFIDNWGSGLVINDWETSTENGATIFYQNDYVYPACISASYNEEFTLTYNGYDLALSHLGNHLSNHHQTDVGSCLYNLSPDGERIAILQNSQLLIFDRSFQLTSLIRLDNQLLSSYGVRTNFITETILSASIDNFVLLFELSSE